MKQQNTPNPQLNAVKYYLITFSLSWGIWGILILCDLGLESLLGWILYIIGGLGPFIGGLICTHYLETKTFQH